MRESDQASHQHMAQPHRNYKGRTEAFNAVYSNMYAVMLQFKEEKQRN